MIHSLSIRFWGSQFCNRLLHTIRALARDPSPLTVYSSPEEFYCSTYTVTGLIHCVLVDLAGASASTDIGFSVYVEVILYYQDSFYITLTWIVKNPIDLFKLNKKLPIMEVTAKNGLWCQDWTLGFNPWSQKYFYFSRSRSLHWRFTT